MLGGSSTTSCVVVVVVTVVVEYIVSLCVFSFSAGFGWKVALTRSSSTVSIIKEYLKLHLFVRSR